MSPFPVPVPVGCEQGNQGGLQAVWLEVDRGHPSPPLQPLPLAPAVVTLPLPLSGLATPSRLAQPIPLAMSSLGLCPCSICLDS